ncbi:hypothetical protein I5506_01125 [Bacillus pumilus]|nr:hypothetical protein [Bacillus pumilus]
MGDNAVIASGAGVTKSMEIL